MNIENEDWSEELLTHIIELWLTVRGFIVVYQCSGLKSTESRKKKD